MLGSVEMPRAECEALLRTELVGRVSVCTLTGPHTAPVTYAVIDELILFRTSPYSVLGTHGRNATLAFEVDDYDDRAQGWSVQATGRGEVVTSEESLAQIRAVWPPAPWSWGMRHLVMQLSPTAMTGTRTRIPG